MKQIMAITFLTVAAASFGGSLKVDPSQTIHITNRHNLTGSNIALWNQPWELSNPDLSDYVRELKPGFIRLPGGSWANRYYWNGNGVRTGESNIDRSKHRKDGTWEVNYSGFAPGFYVEGENQMPVSDGFHGSWDVKQLTEMATNWGARVVVTVNLGSGTPEMAAEWVRWANIKNNYHVTCWELGNELEGRWELGHVLPDGREMTGEIYAQRFKRFAKAMKAVDPTIQTGGPASANDRGAFIKEVLRDAGDWVDFVSFHTYPVKNRQKSEAELFDAVYTLEPAMKKIRGWIAEYQSTRKDQIKVAITEWNSKVVEDRDTADLMNGLWSCIWIGEMFRTGVSFADQWDMMTATETGGHGLFYFDQFNFEQPGVSQAEMDRQFQSFNPPCIPKGQYWALWLWSRWMGDKMVASTLSGAPDVYSAVTRSTDGLQILLVNRSREQAEPVQLQSTQTLADQATAIQLSHCNYFWNPYTCKPQWSRRPEAVSLDISHGITAPPFSALVLKVPFKTVPTLGKAKQTLSQSVPTLGKTEPAALELLLPETTPEDVPVEAWVLASNTAPCSANAEPKFAKLAVTGPAKLSKTRVRINEGAGRFFITPTGTGAISVTAKTEKEDTTGTLQSVSLQARTEILWTFEDAPLSGVRSDYPLSISDTAKPNQQTASIQLKSVQPKPGNDVLLSFEPIPAHVDKERIGGVVFEARASQDLTTDDPHAALQIVLQSESDHWIPIGTVPLNDLKKGWQKMEFRIQNHEQLPSMKRLYAIRIQLVSTQPVTGKIFINDAGVILR